MASRPVWPPAWQPASVVAPEAALTGPLASAAVPEAALTDPLAFAAVPYEAPNLANVPGDTDNSCRASHCHHAVSDGNLLDMPSSTHVCTLDTLYDHNRRLSRSLIRTWDSFCISFGRSALILDFQRLCSWMLV